MPRRGGWRRLGRKRVRYVDAHGDPIRDEVELERIRALVIPPAWHDVWISPNPRARLQATGIDAAGRKQYIYHPTYRAAREREKFERLIELAAALPGLRARTANHLRLGPYEQEWACALAVGLLDKVWFRVGSDRHAQSGRTYGVTTLRKRHALVADGEIRFSFAGKNRLPVRRTVRNAALARGIAALLDLPNGSRLFRYEQRGEVVDLTSPTLNAYLAEHLGGGFTAKDFRTWGGTLVAAVELEKEGAPADDAEAKRALVSVMRKVGAELGNTPAVARDSYVSPAVVDAFRAGTTLADFRSRNGAGPRRLSGDERALVALLRAASR